MFFWHFLHTFMSKRPQHPQLLYYLLFAHFCSGSASHFVIHGNYLIFGQIRFICLTLWCLSNSSAGGGGVAALTLICLWQKKKRILEQLAWAPKSIIIPSISRQTCSPLSDNVPSSIFMKVLLNYMLWIMRLISEIGLLHFFLSVNYMDSRPECSIHAFPTSFVSRPQAHRWQPQPLFTDIINSQLGAKC